MNVTIALNRIVIASALSLSPRANGQDASSDQSHHATLIAFDAPGATTISTAVCAPSCGTSVFANKDLGTTVGFNPAAEVVLRTYLRTRARQGDSSSKTCNRLFSIFHRPMVAFS